MPTLTFRSSIRPKRNTRNCSKPFANACEDPVTPGASHSRTSESIRRTSAAVFLSFGNSFLRNRRLSVLMAYNPIEENLETRRLLYTHAHFRRGGGACGRPPRRNENSRPTSNGPVSFTFSVSRNNPYALPLLHLGREPLRVRQSIRSETYALHLVCPCASRWLRNRHGHGIRECRRRNDSGTS